MKLILLLTVLGAFCSLSSCAYSIPNGGQSVVSDVSDALVGQPTADGRLMAVAPSTSHAQARSAQSSAFWGSSH